MKKSVKSRAPRIIKTEYDPLTKHKVCRMSQIKCFFNQNPIFFFVYFLHLDQSTKTFNVNQFNR